MDTLQVQVEKLQRLARQQLFLDYIDEPVYADDISRVNTEIRHLVDALFPVRGKDAEQEAALCLSLLMGYNAVIYGQDDDKKKQIILDRIFRILNQLSPSLLKCQLLIYCYGEVLDAALADEANEIINSWQERGLTKEEQKIAETLEYVHSQPCN